MQAARGVVFSSKSCSASFPASKRVLTEISNVVRGSKIQHRGRSFAASVPSDLPNPHRRKKRVSKQDRRAMVESFVHEYRISNAGKLPTISLTKNQVGGSYYVIREILQELEYKLKFSNVNQKDEALLEKTEKVILPNLNAMEEPLVVNIPKKASNSSVMKDFSTSTDLCLEITERSSMEVLDHPKITESLISRQNEAISEHVKVSQISFEDKDALIGEGSDLTPGGSFRKSIVKDAEISSIKSQISDKWIEFEVDSKDNNTRLGTSENMQDISTDSSSDQAIHSTVGTHRHQFKLESREVLQQSEEMEDSKKDGIVDKGSDNLKVESVLKNVHEGLESNNFDRDSSKELPSEEARVERSTVWGNLKSLADGIINLWRKL